MFRPTRPRGGRGRHERRRFRQWHAAVENLLVTAAFDHRHIFLDPNPDAAAIWEERNRLFALPRSSWDDYDRSIMSQGGGIFPRSQKEIRSRPKSAPRWVWKPR
jgi:hypothetical protein